MMRLRQAQAADAEPLAALYLQVRRHDLPYAPLAHDDAAVHAWFAQRLVPAGRVTLAERDGVLLGFAACSTQDGVLWLEQLYVASSVQGQGVGAALLHQVLSQAMHGCRLFVFQANRRARQFYEAHGFELLALGAGENNEERCPDALYQYLAPPARNDHHV